MSQDEQFQTMERPFSAEVARRLSAATHELTVVDERNQPQTADTRKPHREVVDTTQFSEALQREFI